VKACTMEGRTIQIGRKVYTVCGYDGSKRSECKRTNCPHFRPTLLFKWARKVKDRDMR
jgi:hypothetical protein